MKSLEKTLWQYEKPGKNTGNMKSLEENTGNMKSLEKTLVI